MMELQSKKNKLFLLVSIAVIIIGILAFVLAYGLSKGWAAVGAWFISKYAILLYIGLGCYAILVCWLFLAERIRKL